MTPINSFQNQRDPRSSAEKNCRLQKQWVLISLPAPA